jgi:hypothetical protein
MLAVNKPDVELLPCNPSSLSYLTANTQRRGASYIISVPEGAALAIVITSSNPTLTLNHDHSPSHTVLEQEHLCLGTFYPEERLSRNYNVVTYTSIPSLGITSVTPGQSRTAFPILKSATFTKTKSR